MFSAQLHGIQTGPVAVTMSDRHVHILASEVDVVHHCRHTQIDLGVHLGEFTEPMNEPLRRKIWRCANGQYSRFLLLGKACGPKGDPVECIAHDAKIFAPGLGDYETLPFAIEQLEAKASFQRFHLMADSTLGYA